MFTLLTWAAILLLGGAILAFWEEIKDWMEDVYKEIKSFARKAKTYIRRVPGAVKAFVYYIKNGRFKKSETTIEEELTPEDIDKMVREGVITKEQGDALKRGEDVQIDERFF